MASIHSNRLTPTRYARRMSGHLSAALLVFALAQIVIVAKLHGSLAMHLAIVLTVGAYAAAARGIEHRWMHVRAGEDAGLARRLRIDLTKIWLAALILPSLWIPATILGRYFFG